MTKAHSAMQDNTANNRIPVTALNAMSREEFVAALGVLLEGSPDLVGRAWDARPFASLGDVHGAVMDAVNSGTEEEKLALLRAHPELCDRLTPPSPESASEQAKAGLDRMTPEELQQFRRLNAEYRHRHGFPFIICARLNSKRSILAAFARRLRKLRHVEFQTALNQVAKIARLRLADRVTE
jgi:2-oxo-4-hydroxy-4-carboxy-5-ureidoimidazoline decarboxylase